MISRSRFGIAEHSILAKPLFALTACSGLLACGAPDERAGGESVASAESAARNRRRPTAPANFRVTGTTPFSASLAWSPASDDSANFSYVIASTAGSTITLPTTATSATFSGLYPRNSYTFIIYALDAAGNASSSVSVSASLPRDTEAPSVAPVLSVVDVGATFVSLSWTPAVDDGPHLFYQVIRDGSVLTDAGVGLSTTLHLLSPNTPYTFAVRAHDYGPNWSPTSTPVTVTTAPPNPNDSTPPTTPTNLRGDWWSDGEVHLRWDASSDDTDPAAVLRYDVYVNGFFADVLIGRPGPSIVYADVGKANLFEVFASDTAGNRSNPATLTLVLSN